MKITPFAYVFHAVWFVVKHIIDMTKLVICVPIALSVFILFIEYVISGEMFGDSTSGNMVPDIIITSVFLFFCVKYALTQIQTDAQPFSFKTLVQVKDTSSKQHPIIKVFLKGLLFSILLLPMLLLGFSIYSTPHMTAGVILSILLFMMGIVYIRLRFILIATAMEDIATIEHIWCMTKGFNVAYFKFMIALLILTTLWLILNAIFFVLFTLIESTWANTIWGESALFIFIGTIYWLFYAMYNHAFLLFYLDLKKLYHDTNTYRLWEI